MKTKFKLRHIITLGPSFLNCKRDKQNLHVLPDWIVRIKQDLPDLKKLGALQILNGVGTLMIKHSLGMLSGSPNYLAQEGDGLFARALPGTCAWCVSSLHMNPDPAVHSYGNHNPQLF